MDSLTVVNQQIVAGLARQNLPKCQPDVFSGDPTLFHPWRSAFKAMLMDTDVFPTQKISFTSGAPQHLVDSYTKRQMHDPVTLLRDMRVELEKHFESTNLSDFKAFAGKTLEERTQCACSIRTQIILSVGSHKADLHSEAVCIYKLYRGYDIRLTMEWDSQEYNTVTDELS